MNEYKIAVVHLPNLCISLYTVYLNFPLHSYVLNTQILHCLKLFRNILSENNLCCLHFPSFSEITQVWQYLKTMFLLWLPQC